MPLFILMGVILEKSRVAEELLGTMAKLFGGLRGGLGISVVVVGMLLAASSENGPVLISPEKDVPIGSKVR